MSVQGRDPSPVSAETHGPAEGEQILDLQSARQPRALSTRPGSFPKVPPCGSRASILPRRSGGPVPGPLPRQRLHRCTGSWRAEQLSWALPAQDGQLSWALPDQDGQRSRREVGQTLRRLCWCQTLFPRPPVGLRSGRFHLEVAGGAAKPRAGSPGSVSVKLMCVAHLVPRGMEGYGGNDGSRACPGSLVQHGRGAHVDGEVHTQVDAHTGGCT